MDRFKFLKKEGIAQLPKTPGVYAFKNNKSIFYIGKAINIRERVKTHFKQPTYRDNLFLNKIKKVGFIKTGSEIEALLLEANLIKKYQPKFNVAWKDDKNYFYIAITKEECPVVSITHQPTQKKPEKEIKIDFIGPFVDGASLRKALRVLRRVFPYYSQKNHPKNLCLWCHLKLCPGPDPDSKQYKKDIKNLISVLKGKKQTVLESLKKEMKNASIKQDFEKAGKTRDQVFALERVLSHAKIIESQADLEKERNNWLLAQKFLRKLLKMKNVSRIEGYDVSNIQGQKATGSMVVFIEGSPNKNFYRKFKIKMAGKPNDVAMLKETLQRRLSHPEWPLPELILIDGGKGQLNAALSVKSQMLNVKSIKFLSLAKRNNELFIEGRKQPVLLKSLPREIFNLILQIRDESHRFAISYHHKLRRVDFT